MISDGSLPGPVLSRLVPVSEGSDSTPELESRGLLSANPRLSKKPGAELMGTPVFILLGAGSGPGGGNLTGAATNQARALGPVVAGGFVLSSWYAYVIGPVLGAVAAGVAYPYLIGARL
jgi:Major intrinsic protein